MVALFSSYEDMKKNLKEVSFFDNLDYNVAGSHCGEYADVVYCPSCNRFEIVPIGSDYCPKCTEELQDAIEDSNAEIKLSEIEKWDCSIVKDKANTHNIFEND